MAGAQRAKLSRKEVRLERSGGIQIMCSFEDFTFSKSIKRSLRGLEQKDDTVPHKFPLLMKNLSPQLLRLLPEDSPQLSHPFRNCLNCRATAHKVVPLSRAHILTSTGV